LACNPCKDKGLEGLKNKTKEYEGRIDNIGCVSLENYVKQDSCKSLDSLRNDSAFPVKLHKFLKDSLGLGCDPMSLRLNNGPYNINVFLQNSSSMDGFINGLTDFKSKTSELLNDLTRENIGTLYHVNSTVDSGVSGKNIGDSINTLNYRSFVQKGYMAETTLVARDNIRKFTDLKNIMKTAIDSFDSLSISIVISDLNMNMNIIKNDTNIIKPPPIERIVATVSQDIKSLLGKKQDMSLFILRFESDFAGYYYANNGKCYIDSSNNIAMSAKIEPLKKERATLKREYDEFWRLINALKHIPKSRMDGMNYRSTQDFAKKIDEIDNYDKPKIDSIGRKITLQMRRLKTVIDSYDSEISYFDKKCKEIIGDSISRPYFIWIFGTEPQLEKVLKSQFFKEKNVDIAKYIRKRNNPISKLEVLDCPNYKNIKGNNCPENQSYDTLNLAFYQTFGDSILIRKNYEKKLEIPVKLNFGGIARIASDILQDKKHYALNDTVNFIIEKHQNANEFVVKSKDNSKYNIHDIRSLSAKIEPKYDWIGKYSCYDDLNFVYNYGKKQTPGLDSLLGKIHSLFYEHPLSSFQIKIGAKQCKR